MTRRRAKASRTARTTCRSPCPPTSARAFPPARATPRDGGAGGADQRREQLHRRADLPLRVLRGPHRASTKSSRSFLDKIFISFSDIHDATEKAAKGANDLKDGVGKAKKGSDDLVDGVGKTKNGSSDLATGLKKIDAGASELATGTREIAKGTQQLADRVNGTAAQARPYLRDNGKKIGDTARLVSDTSKAAQHNLDRIVERGPAARTVAHASADRLTAAHTKYCGKGEGLVDPSPSCART